MTSTNDTASSGVYSVTAEQAKAEAMPQGRDRDIALLRANAMAHVLNCHGARTQSKMCSQRSEARDNGRGGTTNIRPYLLWDCCNVHRALGAERRQLRTDAYALRVELRFQAAPNGQDLHRMPDGSAVLYVDIDRVVTP